MRRVPTTDHGFVRAKTEAMLCQAVYRKLPRTTAKTSSNGSGSHDAIIDLADTEGQVQRYRLGYCTN